MKRYLHIFEDTMTARFKFNNIKCMTHQTSFLQFNSTGREVKDLNNDISHVFIGKEGLERCRGCNIDRIFLNCKLDNYTVNNILAPTISCSKANYINEFIEQAKR